MSVTYHGRTHYEMFFGSTGICVENKNYNMHATLLSLFPFFFVSTSPLAKSSIDLTGVTLIKQHDYCTGSLRFSNLYEL